MIIENIKLMKRPRWGNEINLNFILYNPTAERRSASISIPPAQGHEVRLSRDGQSIGGTVQVPGQAWVRLLAEY